MMHVQSGSGHLIGVLGCGELQPIKPGDVLAMLRLSFLTVDFSDVLCFFDGGGESRKCRPT
jgi:hypothetical protein